MNENVEFLNYIYQNAEMGAKGISDLIKHVVDKDLKKLLNEQLKDYEIIKKEAKNKIKEHNETPKGISKTRRIQSYLMIKINTLWSASRHHVAGMLIKGSKLGIMQINEKIDQYKNADKKIIDIAYRLLKIEMNNLEELEKI